MSRFSKFQLVPESEATPENKQFVEKTFKPGRHQVVIAEVLEDKPKDNDPSWLNLRITLAGEGEKKTNMWVLVPTESDEYGPKKSRRPYLKFKAFCEALGITVTKETVQSVLPKYFDDLSKLVGLKLAVEMGWDVQDFRTQQAYHHVQYSGKDAAGSKQYKIQTADGTSIRVSHDGEAEADALFPDFESAKAFAAENDLKLQDYTQVQKVLSGIEKNDLSRFEPKKPKVGWTK